MWPKMNNPPPINVLCFSKGDWCGHLEQPKTQITGAHGFRDTLRVLVFPFLILGACGTGGYLVNKDQIAQLRIGVSTKEDVRTVLGEPKTISSFSDSGIHSETWVYTFARYASDPQTGIPPIGVTPAPISRARRKTTEIEVSFNENDIVSSIRTKDPA